MERETINFLLGDNVGRWLMNEDLYGDDIITTKQSTNK